MKEIVIVCLSCFLCFDSSAQLTTDSTSFQQTDYSKKSKRQKLAGWILAVGGAALFLAVASDDMNQTDDDARVGKAPYAVSAAMFMGGIGFFIASGNSKKKAAGHSLGFKMKRAPGASFYPEKRRSIPVVAFRVQL